MGGSGTSLSRFELENAGLRNELEPLWAWKCESPEWAWSVLSVKMPVSPERPRSRGAAERFAFGLSQPLEAMNGFKLKKFLKMMVSGTAKSAKSVKWWCSGTDFFVICENDMLRNGNSGLKMGVSRAAHIPNMHAYASTPPPPPPGCCWSCNRASELWKSGKSRKWQSIRNYTWNKKILNQIWWSWCYYNEEKILYPARLKNNCWSEQSPKKLTVSAVPATRYTPRSALR